MPARTSTRLGCRSRAHGILERESRSSPPVRVFACVSVDCRIRRPPWRCPWCGRLLRPRVFARLERGVTFIPSVSDGGASSGPRRRAAGVGPGEILQPPSRCRARPACCTAVRAWSGPGVGRIQRHGGHARPNRLRDPPPRERGGSVGVHGRDRGVGRDLHRTRRPRRRTSRSCKGAAALLRSLGHRLRSGAGDRLVYDTRRVHSTSRRWTCAGRRSKRSF